MKAEHINAFIQGAQSTFSMFFGENAALGKVFLKGSPYRAEHVCVEIGITGSLKGKVLYNMNQQSAFFIASKLMMGMPVTALDDMTKSAVSEMANMISGQVASAFFSDGLEIDITPPTLHEADAAAIKGLTNQIVCIPLSFPGGAVFEIDVALA
ncbi:MAG: chemotaxis protein CheX [Clostridiales bacterium]|jgi:chemotaxis protein CheX|nr:chemotaxis protein CheX [Clostridiales bacterium]